MDSKKQIAIIAVLVILIGIVGTFARKLSIDVNENGLETSKGTVNFFSETRMGRDNQRSVTKQEYEEIINNKEVPEKEKTEAAKKHMDLVNIIDKENQIELMIKEMGFEDALCFIGEKGVEVFVKTKENINSEQANRIKELVVKNTKFPPSNIVLKPKQ